MSDRPGTPQRIIGALARLGLWLGGPMLVSCGQVATPAHPGEALAILRGVVANPAGLTLPPGASAHLVWSDAVGHGEVSQVAASTTVETRLPANFSIALYTAPPAAAVVETDGVPRARGDVIVVTDAQLAALSAGDPIVGVHGRTDDFQLLWFESGGDADRYTTLLGLGRSLTAGFNLLARGTGTDSDDTEGFEPVPLASVIPLDLQDGSDLDDGATP